MESRRSTTSPDCRGPDSHTRFAASMSLELRAHLLPYRGRRGPQLYREAVGGLINARRVIEALDAGRIDARPVDSYYDDLLAKSDPDFAAKVRVIATTQAASVPPLVATAPLAPDELERLRAALVAVGGEPELAVQRDVLLLSGFAVPLAA